MKITVFHGSPHKGNTYKATRIFLDELEKTGDVCITDFFLPDALPVFCSGCTLCFIGKKCPHSQYVDPIVDAILAADALVFATPHYGACCMPAAMKTLFDYIDFLVLNVAPREEMFEKKAFIITTGAGSTAAIKPISNFLKHCGVNRVYSLGLRMFTNKWDKMPKAKQTRYEKSLQRAAQKFYRAKKRRPYIYTVVYYTIVKHIIMKRYIGAGNFPYDNWKEKGYFDKRPF
ncbi:MAG: flavodoxin family protein [Defluviitaleaceae bacterium]|nr:flavodoxin family protein [Defluviitaleaceae bacterium]